MRIQWLLFAAQSLVRGEYTLKLFGVSNPVAVLTCGDRLQNNKIINASRQWVESVVVAMNLCPFANRELVANRVRFVVTKSTTNAQLLMALHEEMDLLLKNESVETTLLIHPHVLQRFSDYNQFLSVADALLVQNNLEGIFQVASFHPDYQFAGTDAGDAENYTNRSPYPMLHLIREESLERAIAEFSDADQIPARNIARMKSLGQDRLKALMQACFEGVDK